VLSGPEVLATTDTTLTVHWVTDELATSGVSYNDGTAFFVVTDATPTTEHQLVLAQLRPLTSYEVTISSSDASGNGPTLGGPISAQTAAAPDATGPVISSVAITVTSSSSARIEWHTDEQATSSVSYGKGAGSSDGIEGSAALQTVHSVELAGLDPGVTYFARVTSVDGSGNASTSAEQTFSTTQPISHGDGDGDGVPDGRDSCPETETSFKVDTTGCSVDQLCPCAGPSGTTRAWKNHGDYVSCVEHSVTAFYRARLLTRPEVQAVQRAAEHSQCGQPARGGKACH
jgi:hypothetical protein